MSRVAILGSCITRDVWRFRGASGEGLLYVSRTSLPSLMSPPVAGFTPQTDPPAGLKPQPHRALTADIAKTALPRLLAFRPTHLIFDFIDERFDLLAAGDSLITHSWELEASGYLRQPALQGARPVRRLSRPCDGLWAQAAQEFAALVRATALSDAQLILHVARWAGRSRAADGRARRLGDVEVLPGRPAAVADHNRLLARYEAQFSAIMPPMARIESNHRLADGGHSWGLSPFHYVPEYYADIASQLAELGVTLNGEA